MAEAEPRKASAARRRRIVAELIREGEAASQEALVEHLSRRGIAVTQATVSRDLEEIGAVKIKQGGRQIYALTGEFAQPELPEERLRELFSEWITAVEAAGNLVVIQTPPGSAHMIGSALDRVEWPDMVGTVAGDDTVVIIVRDGYRAADLLARVKNLSEIE